MEPDVEEAIRTEDVVTAQPPPEPQQEPELDPSAYSGVPADNSGGAPVSPYNPGSGDNTGAPPVERGDGKAASWLPQAQKADDQLRSPSVTAGGKPAGIAGVDEGGTPEGTNTLTHAANQWGDAFKKGLSALVSGFGSAPAEAIDQIGQQIDPEGKMTPTQRNMLDIEKVRAEQGEEAAFALMQANRKKYYALTSFAKSAMEGVQGKPPDMNAAINHANMAQGNVLDGSEVKFAMGQGGITATVNGQTINLSPQQFNQFLDIGGDGQWDKITTKGSLETLQKLAGNNKATPGSKLQAPAAKPQTRGPNLPPEHIQAMGRDPTQEMAKDAPHKPGDVPGQQRGRPWWEGMGPKQEGINTNMEAPAGPPRQTNFGTTPSTQSNGQSLNMGESTVRKPAPDNRYGFPQQLEKQAMAMFPNSADEPRRLQYMTQAMEHQANRDNALGVASERGASNERIADKNVAGRQGVANTRADVDREKLAANIQYREKNLKLKGDIAAKNVEAKMAEIAAKDRRHMHGEIGKNIRSYTTAMKPLPPEWLQLLKDDTAVVNYQREALAHKAASETENKPPGPPPVEGAKWSGKYQTWVTRGPDGRGIRVPNQ